MPVANIRNYLILFLIWPFLAFCLALFNYGEKFSRKVVFLFLIYYGLNFVMGDYGGSGPDSERYAMYLKSNAELPFSDFFKIVGGLYSSDTSVDIVEPLISFIVSRFTSHYGVYFAIWAAIFGFFYLKSINFLYDRYRQKPGWNALIHMAFFIVILPITAINGVRMWTAAWIFFYGAYNVILYRDSKYLLVALSASLVHWSFLSANAVLIIYFLAGNRNLIYLPIAIASFLLPNLFIPVFQRISAFIGGSVQGRFENYASQDYMIISQERLEQASWFLKISSDLVFYYLLLALIVIKFRFGDLMREKYEQNLFSFLILFLTFVNFGISIPSFGGRFQIIFFLFATLYVFLFFLKQSAEKISLLTLAGLFPMMLYAVVLFRQDTYSVDAWLFTPGFGIPFFQPGLSLTELLFQ